MINRWEETRAHRLPQPDGATSGAQRQRTQPLEADQTFRRFDMLVKKTLLLVDDDPAVRESLANVLVGEGYQVVPASIGVVALDIAGKMPLDLVLLDLNLPKKNGWDTFEILTRRSPRLPVIIITARSNQLFPALAAGVGALMEKPLDLHKLLQTITNLLQEPVEARLARVAGRPAEFHYLPAHSKDSSKP
jgi:DNA-binding response OmpR family regulator